MLYIVAVFALGSLLEVHAECPVNCNCTDNSVNCVSKALSNIPEFEELPNNPLIMDLSGNSIFMITATDFKFSQSDQIKEIYLNNSALASIEEGAFQSLENLQELYLSDNLLNALPSQFIEENENMILLDLSYNYFEEMPKIRSDSLEVLTIANSGISKIPLDALEDLPNLRMLLLSQNNLKSINPVIFQDMGQLFFISLAYNPWYCNCQTIKLFDFLTERRFIDLTEPVQCQRDDRIFMDIYSERGVTTTFKNKCIGFVGDFEDTEDSNQMLMTLKSLDLEGPIETNTPIKKHLTRTATEDVAFSDLLYVGMLAIAVLLSMIIGAVCGSYLTCRYMNKHITQTESRKELISKDEEAATT